MIVLKLDASLDLVLLGVHVDGAKAFLGRSGQGGEPVVVLRIADKIPMVVVKFEPAVPTLEHVVVVAQ